VIDRPIGIICHGGAGAIEDKVAAAEGLVPALDEAYRLLRQSASAQEAVVTAVKILEDNPSFNAGTGSDLTFDGRVEMDASLMLQDGRFGGVACITRVKNPILVAEKIITETDHALLCGDGALEFARKLGFAEQDVITERARRRLQRVVEHGSKYFPRMTLALFPDGAPPEESPAVPEPPAGTVGAVAVDKHGNLAAATSTGGIAGRLRGRVGDAAVIGAGTYAAPGGAISCTGHGEEIMRRLLAKDIVDRMTTMPASVAMTLAMADARRRKMMCGAVGFDARGGVCYGHTTPDLAYGYKVAERLFLFVAEKTLRSGSPPGGR
jgi:beta-aspartyl-peptidase (threonine type)